LGCLSAMKAGTLPFFLVVIGSLISSSVGLETTYSFDFFEGLPLVFLGTSLVSSSIVVLISEDWDWSTEAVYDSSFDFFEGLPLVFLG